MKYNIEGYEAISKNLRKEDQGIGILVYVNNVCVREEYCGYLSIKKGKQSKNQVITIIYRSPNSIVENRVVDNWIGLPEEVISCNNVLHFEKSLDKVRRDQELKINFKTKINKLSPSIQAMS